MSTYTAHLHYHDKRIAPQPTSVHYTFTKKEPIGSVVERICKFFQVKTDNDWQLFHSMFAKHAHGYDTFHFLRTDNVVCTVRFEGDRLVAPLTRDLEPKEKNAKVSICVSGIGEHQVSFEELSTKRSGDHSVIALFNSKLFKGYAEASTGASRIARVVEIKPILSKL